MTDELAGKVAIVTGGASGLGEGLARRFAAEGAKVLIADVDRDGGAALAADIGANAQFVEADVSDMGQVSDLVTTAVDRFGGLHVMVNNAGVSGTMHFRLLDDDLADFHKVMSVNLLAVMAGTRDAARHMKDNGGGSIINVTSIGGILAGGGVMTYRASKAAVIQFTKSAAIELAHYEIRVNAIAPGNIRTGIVRKSATGEDLEKLEEFEARIREQMRNDRPLKREGTVEDVAEAALYFATDRSRYVTGTVLPVDGGTVAGKVIVRKSPADAGGASYLAIVRAVDVLSNQPRVAAPVRPEYVVRRVVELDQFEHAGTAACSAPIRRRRQGHVRYCAQRATEVEVRQARPRSTGRPPPETSSPRRPCSGAHSPVYRANVH